MKDDMLNKFSAELRKMPYSVPEGYFDGLESKLSAAVSAEGSAKRTFAGKAAVYFYAAAVFLVMLTAGTFFLERSTGIEGLTYEDYVVYSDMLINEYDDDDLHIIGNEVEDEDIIEYLIYTGVTAEVIEQSK